MGGGQPGAGGPGGVGGGEEEGRDFYCPQRSWGKVMFSQACVILFTRGVSASVHFVISFFLL